jgi:3-isopropylmalate/(R)-2-methylmalate dehydratase small subunit
MSARGKVWKYGDHVNTDVIIPGRYCNLTEEEDLRPHALEDLDPDFAKKVQPGDVVVAGENFGMGSSRELAPYVIKIAGASAVVAKGFARIFYRNAINIGLPIFVSAEAVDGTDAGDEMEVDLASGEIRNVTKGVSFQSQPYPEFMREIMDKGGLMEWVKERTREKQTS